jgi:hypothetical protein
MVLVFLTYRQLFAYGVWGTLWRVLMAFVCAITLWSIMLNTSYGVHLLRMQHTDVARGYFLNAPIALAFLVFILFISYIISRPRKKKHASSC